jgi:hypothetical protein
VIAAAGSGMFASREFLDFRRIEGGGVEERFEWFRTVHFTARAYHGTKITLDDSFSTQSEFNIKTPPDPVSATTQQPYAFPFSELASGVQCALRHCKCAKCFVSPTSNPLSGKRGRPTGRFHTPVAFCPLRCSPTSSTTPAFPPHPCCQAQASVHLALLQLHYPLNLDVSLTTHRSALRSSSSCQRYPMSYEPMLAGRKREAGRRSAPAHCAEALAKPCHIPTPWLLYPLVSRLRYACGW